jgi:hypothetical protein
VDLPNVEVGNRLVGNNYPVVDIIPLGIYFGPPLGRCPSVSICFLVYLLLLHEFCSQEIDFGLHLVMGSQE